MNRFSQIKYSYHEDLKALVFNLKENDIVDDESFIEKMILFVELVGYLKPVSIIINKLKSDFDVSLNLRSYAKAVILSDIKRHEVQRLYFIVEGEKVEDYFNLPIKPDFVLPFIPCKSINEALENERKLLNERKIE
jgi:hypothetical protein